MNKIANRQVICGVLLEHAKIDRDITVLCSDSRGSGSMTDFAEQLPSQFIEVGIAEQNLVSMAAGLASCGKKAYAVSPACFLASRSLEQAKVDVAYSNTNVKLVGISGGVSYGALGMSHHSTQDIAAMASIPNMRVYIPSDQFLTKKLFESLLRDSKPAYIRVGRNPSDDIYDENLEFKMDRAQVIKKGNDVLIIACGDMIKPSYEAALMLEKAGINASVLDMYCVKPLDSESILKFAYAAKMVITVEEHVKTGGLGAMVSQLISENCPKKVLNIALPDESVIAGTQREIFNYYGLTAEGIFNRIKGAL